MLKLTKIFLLLLVSANFAQSPLLVLMGEEGGYANPEVDAYLIRVLDAGGNISAETANAYDVFFTDISTIRTKLLRVNLFAGDDTAAVFTPIIFNADGSESPLGYSRDLNSGFIPSDYSESVGLTGDGSSYLNTGFNPNSISAFGLNDAGLSVYSMTESQAATWEIGADDGNRLFIVCSFSGGDAYFPVNNTDYSSSATTNGAGLFTSTRLLSTELSGYRNGVVLGAAFPHNSTAKPNRNIYVFAYNTGSASAVSSRTLGGYAIHKGLNESEIILFNTAIEKFQDALGRGVQ